MDLAQILGWIATFLFSVMIIPQVVKTIKMRSTEGVSLSLFIIFLIANFVALAYAIMINQFPLIFKYVLAIMTTVFYISIYFLYSIRYPNKTYKQH
ncbi:MAG: PQ-loop repeat-containing protein [Nanoarchaeota archaeon]